MIVLKNTNLLLAFLLEGVWYWLMKVVFFGLAIAGLVAAGQRTWGTVFAIVFAINSALLLTWKQ